jgi:hypothetical protein
MLPLIASASHHRLTASLIASAPQNKPPCTLAVSSHPYGPSMPDVDLLFQVLGPGVVVKKAFLSDEHLDNNDLHHVLVGVDRKLADFGHSM